MTKEMKNRVADELKKAYAYFGDTDEVFMKEKANEAVETLAALTTSMAPETIRVGEEVIEGYVIDVALSAYDPAKIETVFRNGKSHTHERVTAVQMVVTKTTMYYVINAYDVYKPEGWQYGDDFECENETYEKVALEDINVALFN